MKQGPVSDREYGRRVAEASEAYRTAMDMTIAQRWPNADGAAIRSFTPTEWDLTGSFIDLPRQEWRRPTIREVERLARMADERQRINRMPEDELFNVGPKVGA